MKSLVLGLVFGIVFAAAPSWAAPSKCDAGISKAIGKNVACRCGVYAKAQLKDLAPDGAKLDKCAAKFAKSCLKAQGKGDCNVQIGTCPSKEVDIDAAASSLCSPSPSPAGAFID